jgi:hypothetical protein
MVLSISEGPPGPSIRLFEYQLSVLLLQNFFRGQIFRGQIFFEGKSVVGSETPYPLVHYNIQNHINDHVHYHIPDVSFQRTKSRLHLVAWAAWRSRAAGRELDPTVKCSAVQCSGVQCSAV